MSTIEVTEALKNYSPKITYSEKRDGVLPSTDCSYIYNTLKNLNKRLKLLEETVVNLNKKSDTEPKTIYGTHTFLDCPEQDSKRTEDFYNK